MSKELISVIIPCYNQGQFIDEAVDSVLSQTYDNIEVIVVNDGSTDPFTIDLLREYDRPKTKVITTENQGLAEARNTAILAAQGKYILPLDADDKIAPTYCQKAIDVIISDDNLGIVHGETQNFGDNTEVRQDPPSTLEEILKKNTILCSSMYRKTDWETVGGYKKNMKYGGEDWDFWLSILELGRKVYKIPEIMFYYRIRSSSMARSIDEDKFRKLRKQIYLNHLDLYLSHFPDPITLFWEKHNAERENQKILNSFAYRVVSKVVTPLKKIKD